MKKITAALIGAGMRGLDAYASYALENPAEIQFIAVAELRQERRDLFQKLHNISDSMCFTSWEELLKQPKLADSVFICTQDNDHYEVTLQALEKGYHVLLEKPMSNNPKECIDMVKYSEKNDRIFSVCHVLRYTPFFMTIKTLLDNKVIGDIVTVEHSENVAYWHQAHSYVRGNWRNSQISSPMILAKSCHDLDILLWLIGKDCKKISSFGSLKYFKKENAPKGAPKRCLDGCPARYDCAFYAPKVYIRGDGTWQSSVIRKVVSQDTSVEALTKALKEGPYGRCVFHCDNDVVDHQVVNMEFEDDITVSFTMCAFTYDETRKSRFLGTKGELSGNTAGNYIEYTDFLTGTKKTIKLNQSDEGHGGGDHGIVMDFVKTISENTDSKSSAKKSLQSHILAFAAEESRLKGTVLDIKEFMRSQSTN